MANEYNNIKSHLGLGARSNRYRVTFNAPAGVPGWGSNDKVNVLCKSASLPGYTIGNIEIYSQGLVLPIAGDIEFEKTWEVSFYNSQDHSVRKLISAWMTKIHDAITNTRGIRDNAEHRDYMVDLYVEQLNTERNESTYGVIIHNCWPSSIGSVELADDSNNAVSEFSVTFTYSHWEPNNKSKA